jgi:hypothetical protein
MDGIEHFSLILMVIWMLSFVFDWVRIKRITTRSWLLLLMHLLFASLLSLIQNEWRFTFASAGILGSTICFVLFIFKQVKSRREK